MIVSGAEMDLVVNHPHFASWSLITFNCHPYVYANMCHIFIFCRPENREYLFLLLFLPFGMRSAQEFPVSLWCLKIDGHPTYCFCEMSWSSTVYKSSYRIVIWPCFRDLVQTIVTLTWHRIICITCQPPSGYNSLIPIARCLSYLLDWFFLIYPVWHFLLRFTKICYYFEDDHAQVFCANFIPHLGVANFKSYFKPLDVCELFFPSVYSTDHYKQDCPATMHDVIPSILLFITSSFSKTAQIM